MARRRGAPRGFVRPPKKTVLWIDNHSISAPSTIAANVSLLFSQLSATGLALRPFTIMRNRGFVWMATDQATNSEEPFGVYGEIVVTESASAIGITAIPTPMTETNASWVTWAPMVAAMRFSTAAAFANMGQHFEVDSKAMRKVGIDDDLVGIVQNGSSSHGLQFLAMMRTLIQLH